MASDRQNVGQSTGRIKSWLQVLVLIIFSGLILAMSIRGIGGNPTAAEILNKKWKEDGPFELSPERGRFALTYSLVENKTFYFSVPLARFILPDLGYKNGHYVSLFAPGVSYVVAPGYWVGKWLGSSQVGAFAVVALFGLGNLLLIRAIAVRLGADKRAATLGGLAFLFASPAFAYAVTLYQHQISTFLILASLYLLVKFNSWWSLLVIWFLCAASIPVDYPNLFLMTPIALMAVGKMVYYKKSRSGVLLGVKLGRIFTMAAAVLPLVFFMWFNQQSYGNPWQLSGTVPGVEEIDANGNPTAPAHATVDKDDLEKYFDPELQKKSIFGFFETRELVNGLYIHLFSPDRGVIYYAPLVLVGLLGGVWLYRRNPEITVVCLGVVAADILLYSMWGDPWGGWAFGSRYLIPSYAMAGILLAFLLTRLRKRSFGLMLIWLLMGYGVAVSAAGALTTNALPPKVQVLELEKLSGMVQKYTYRRNFDQLLVNNSKSFLFGQEGHKYVSAWQYYLVVVGLIMTGTTGLMVMLRWGGRND